jgi:photosystem II stability/assembly factor-like uncharacterized protein
MWHRIPVCARWFVVTFALASGLSLSLAPVFAQDPAKAKKIADIEKQIQSLTKELESLKTPAAPAEAQIPDAWIKALNWRCIGPANMGGRITAIAAYEADPTTYWIATASGGLVKTVNNGITFDHQFDREATVSIGDVCVAPSDKNMVWVGTGEANPRNSVSYGDGVYKSIDGGKTWKNMGLKQSFQIGKIQIHPKNPDIVYVGALGRLYGPNEDRGVFKTTDGGKTWKKVLYINDHTGIIDMQMHPTDPDTLLVAAWDRQRDEFDDFAGEPKPPDGIEEYDPIRKYGKGAGIYKTTDGGKTFHRLTNGLPTVMMGRIGLDYYRKDPNIVWAVIDTEKHGTGEPPLPVQLGAYVNDDAKGLKVFDVEPKSPAAKAELKVDDLILSIDGKPTADKKALFENLKKHKPGDKIQVAYLRGKDKKEASLTLAGPGGGARMPSLGFFADDAVGGLIVTTLVDGGPAMRAGLQYDDVVTAIDGQAVSGRMFQIFGRLMTTHKPGDKIKVAVTRGENKLDLVMPLEMASMATARGTPKPIPGHQQRPNSPGMGAQFENVQDTQGPEGFQTGGVYRSADGGETWARINSSNPRPMYFSVIRVDPTDENYVYLCGVSLVWSKNRGLIFTTEGINKGVHSDQHCMWIDPHNGRHMIVGADGGFYQTYDRGQNWDHLNHLALGQFYHVVVDPRPLYRVYGGLQDNGSWCGPAQSLRPYGPVSDDWLVIGGGDGFVCRVDPTDPDIVYAESQGGNIQRRNLKTGQRAFIRPARIVGQPEHRFNWNTPYILSSQNPSIFYVAGEYVWRSMERGEHLKAISPEITRTKHGTASALAESPMNPDVLWVGSDDGALWVTRDGGSHWSEVASSVSLPGPRCVASIEPSRYAEGRAYVAFDAHRSNDDDPYVYVTEDYGQTWKSIRGNLPWGSTRVCREDIQKQNILYTGTEFAAWISTNRGGSWTKLNHNLPTVAVHEFAQHPTSGEVVAATHGRSLWIVDVTPLRQVTADVVKAPAHLFEPNRVVKWKMEEGRDGWFSESQRRFAGSNPPRGAEIYYSLDKKAKSVSLKVFDYTGKQVNELKAKNELGLSMVAWNLAGRGGPGAPAGMRGGHGGRSTAEAGAEKAATEKSASGKAAKAAPGKAREAPSSTEKSKKTAETEPMKGSKKPAAASKTETGEKQPGGAAATPVTSGAAAAVRRGAAPAEEEIEGPPPEIASFFGFRGPPQVAAGMYRVVLTVDGKEQSQWFRVEADPNHPETGAATQGEDLAPEDYDP